MNKNSTVCAPPNSKLFSPPTLVTMEQLDGLREVVCPELILLLLVVSRLSH